MYTKYLSPAVAFICPTTTAAVLFFFLEGGGVGGRGAYYHMAWTTRDNAAKYLARSGRIGKRVRKTHLLVKLEFQEDFGWEE